MDGKSKGLIMLSIISVVAILGGILLASQAYNAQVTAADSEQNAANQTDVTTVGPQLNDLNYADVPQCPGMGRGIGMEPFGRHGGPGPFGMGEFGGIEVSAEFKDNVINIAKNDSDVQQLLNDGYNVTNVMPTIKTVLNGDGSVVTKATNATLMLEKDTSGRALVSVDLTQSKVTQIVILTRTVINKP